MRTPALTTTSLRVAAAAAALTASALVLAPAATAATPHGVAVTQYQGRGCTAGISIQLVDQGRRVTTTVTCNGGVTVVSVVVRSNPVALPLVAPDAAGRSTYSVDTSDLPVGQHTITYTFSDGTSQVLDFEVVRPQASVVPVQASGGGGLAFTGAEAVVPIGALGAVLVLGGAGAVVGSRRRRHAA